MLNSTEGLKLWWWCSNKKFFIPLGAPVRFRGYRRTPTAPMPQGANDEQRNEQSDKKKC